MAARHPKAELDGLVSMPHLSGMPDTLTNAAEFTVSEIAQAVRRTVEDEFGQVTHRVGRERETPATGIDVDAPLNRRCPPHTP